MRPQFAFAGAAETELYAEVHEYPTNPTMGGDAAQTAAARNVVPDVDRATAMAADPSVRVGHFESPLFPGLNDGVH